MKRVDAIEKEINNLKKENNILMNRHCALENEINFNTNTNNILMNRVDAIEKEIYNRKKKIIF